MNALRVSLAVVLLLTGCELLAPDSEERQQFNDALAAWKRQGVENYSFQYQRSCECIEEWTRPAFLVVRAGRVVEATATRGQEFLESFLAHDAGAAVLGEIALGCNAAVARSTGSPLVDEKIGGTFHLALGASYPATGGRNRSAVHWDLVGDLRHGGQVEVDGQVISQDGRFVRTEWPPPHYFGTR